MAQHDYINETPGQRLRNWILSEMLAGRRLCRRGASGDRCHHRADLGRRAVPARRQQERAAAHAL